MATRRNFFKYLGLAGGVATGGVVAAAAVLPDPEKAECVKQVDGTTAKILFNQTYGERVIPQPRDTYLISSQEPQYVPGTRKEVTIGMNVGPDGELYLKVNGKWRKVVTE